MKTPTKTEKRRQEELAFKKFLSERGSELGSKFDATQNRYTVEASARESLFLSQLNSQLSKLRRKYQYHTDTRSHHIKKSPELVLNVNLSDLHYGAFLDKREVPLAYGHTEEARRTAALALWIGNHRTLSERRAMVLHLNLLGDIIQNQLHDPRDGAPLAEQFAASVHLLVQLIAHCSASGYQKVVVNCTPGNHGRNTARHKTRALTQKWDSIETMIYVAIKEALAHVQNVEINIPYQPYFIYQVFNHRIFATHGDTVLRPGYPGNNINVGDVRNQINEINGKLTPEDRYKVFIVGHVHVASKTKLPNGVYFLSNGCLIPTDAYAQSIGIVETATCQTVFESTPEHVVGYHCEIDVDETTDRDKSLDNIIQPFTSL